MSAKPEKLKPSPEMDKAVQNMFSLPPSEVKRITQKKAAVRKPKKGR